MRIAFITSQSIDYHATMKRALGMAPHLVHRGHETSVILTDTPANRERMAELPGVLPLYFPAGSARQERAFKRQMLIEGNFDVTFGNALGYRNYVLPPRSAETIALMEHCELESAHHRRSLLRRSLTRYQERSSLRDFDGTIAASHYLFFRFRAEMFQRKLHRPLLLLPYAYPDSYRKITIPDREGRGRKRLLYLGLINQSYGVGFLLESLGQLARMRTDWEAVFAGPGETEKWRAYAESLGLGDYVSFSGFVPEKDVPSLLHGSSVLLSHLNDTVQDWARCPSKIYLYLTARCPIVSADVGENPMTLRSLGYYYPPGSVEGASSAISRALDHAGAPVPYPLDEHSWEARADTFLRWLYDSFPALRSRFRQP